MSTKRYEYLTPRRLDIPESVLKYPIAKEMFSIWMNDFYECDVVTNLRKWKKKASLALAHAVAVASQELKVSNDTMMEEISNHLEEMKNDAHDARLWREHQAQKLLDRAKTVTVTADDLEEAVRSKPDQP